jgi:3-oxoacyl-[acyl-carrier protein] reductase
LNILLTGGTRGLGLEIVRHQLQLGHTLTVVNRQTTPEFEALQQTAPERLRFIAADLSDPSQLKDALHSVFAPEAPPIDGLVNNAATAYDDLATNLNLERLEAMFQVNVFAPMLLTKLVIRNMLLHQTKGSLVHISSICTRTGYKGLAMYGATKGALEAYSKNVAREWGSLGIRSNCVVPGFMETDMSAGLPVEQKERIYQRTALRQPTDAGSVAALVDYLLSAASGSVTGQAFAVDSGTL